MKTTIRKSFPMLLGALAMVTQGCTLTYLSADLSKLVGQVAPIEEQGDEIEDLASRVRQKESDDEWSDTQKEVGGSVWTTGVLVDGAGTALAASVRNSLASDLDVPLPPVYTDQNPASYSLDDPRDWERTRDFDEQVVVEPETAAVILLGLYGLYEFLSSFEGSMSFDFSMDSQGSCMSM